MAMADWRTETEEGQWAAIGLAQDLEAGESLPELDTTLQLNPGEKLHVAVPANVWWYGPEDITYQRAHFVAFDSLPWLALTGTGSAIGNHRRRKTAQALATPQWRPLGELPVLLTNQRLLTPTGDDLTSAWLDTAVTIPSDPDDDRWLELIAEGTTPIAVEGSWVPYLKVTLSHLRGALMTRAG